MQLSSIENITEDNIVFHEPKKYQVRNTSIKYKRIKIEIKMPNGKIYPLVVETPYLFSFGVSKRDIQFQCVCGKRMKNQMKNKKTFSIF